MSNAYTGMLEAYTACAPLILITISESSQYSGKDLAKMQHGFDHASAFQPVTKYIKKVETIEEIQEAIEETFKILLSGRPKPALLEISRHALAANKADSDISVRDKSISKPIAIKKQITQAVDLLVRARRPFILAGRGIYHAKASSELLEFAQLLNAPVATTAMGKGAISENQTLSLGYIKTESARKAMTESDLIIAIGNRFVQMDTDNWMLEMSQPLIHIEADLEEINKEYKSNVGISGDLKLVLRQLIDTIKTKNIESNWELKLNDIKKMRNSHKKSRYFQQLRQVIASDAILCVDVHWLGYSACSDFEVYDACSFLHSPISMTMGFALPTAIGAKIAFPDRQVIAFCGDGGFMISSPEFATIVKYDLNIVIIIINDNAYGTIKDVQMRHFGNTIGVELNNPDFVKYAEAFGTHGFRISGFERFKQTLEDSLKLDGPVLIEVLPNRSIKGKIYSTYKNVEKYLKYVSPKLVNQIESFPSKI
jgi:acetolactate synthase-1/2/3 large subunit